MPGFPIPVQMPTGIQAGDELLVFMTNIQINPVSIIGPSGWTGVLSTGWFWKTADGSEDGAVLNWTTQDTTETFNTSVHRVLTIAALCYRFKPYVPQSMFRFFDAANALASSTTATDIPGGGLVASNQLRVFAAFGQGSDAPSDPATVHALTGITWTNPTDRTGLIALDWANDGFLNDSNAMSVADVEYEYPPPFAVYNPHDAVTAFGGSYSTGIGVYGAVYNLPQVCDNGTGGGPLVDYEITSTVVTQGGTADIQMPASVRAGDYLVLFMGNLNENVIDPSQAHAPAGWTQVWSQSSDYEWYKLADGTEGGTTVHFPVISSFPVGGPQRPWVAGVLQYRFTETPTIQSLGANHNFSASGFGGGHASSGSYGPFYVGGTARELRVYGVIGYGTDSGGFPVPLNDTTWTNATKRTPLFMSEASLSGGFPDIMSFQMADEIDFSTTAQKASVVINSSGASTGADIFGIRFVFANAQCLGPVAYWGINASTPT
jgi:hypothetical protein